MEKSQTDSSGKSERICYEKFLSARKPWYSWICGYWTRKRKRQTRRKTVMSADRLRGRDLNPRPPGYLSEAPPLKAPLRFPKTAAGDAAPLRFSTAAEAPLCLAPPPAAQRGAFPPSSARRPHHPEDENSDLPMKDPSPPSGGLGYLVAGEGFEPTTSGL